MSTFSASVSAVGMLCKVRKETRIMVSLHVPNWFSLMGIVVGVALLPLAILGTLFLIVRALGGM